MGQRNGAFVDKRGRDVLAHAFDDTVLGSESAPTFKVKAHCVTRLEEFFANKRF